MNKRVVRSYSFSERNKKTVSGSFRSPSNRKQINIFWLIIISFFVFIIAILCLFFSRVFYISNVKIEGLKTIDSEKIEKIVFDQEETKFLMFSQKNLFLFNKDKLINNLSDFNFINIKVDKKLFKKSLIIKIEERQSAIIFLENGVYFMADKEGNIIDYKPDCQAITNILTKNNSTNDLNSTSTENLASTTNTNELLASSSTSSSNTSTVFDTSTVETNNISEDSNNILKTLDPNTCITVDDNYKKENLYPIIENTGNSKIDENKKNIDISSEYIDFCLKLYNDIGENVDFGLKNIILDESYNTVKIKLNNGPEVYFNLKNDYSEQVNSLLILENELKSELQGKKYIDLRYGDKIFFN